MVSWPIAMTTWTQLNGTVVDGVAGATPLNVFKHGGTDALFNLFGTNDWGTIYQSLFFGFRNGSLGETSTVLLILGGLWLIYKGYINWQVPVIMIATVGILMGAIYGSANVALFEMMAGGLIIGAFFMATDMVTAPITLKGQMIFALGCGLITVLIRTLGGYPEGVCYSILLMNTLTPLIDRLVKPTVFGAVKRGLNKMADKNESGIFKVAMNLVLTCLVSGCIIGAVFFITGPTATAKAEQMKQDSMKSLVPQAEKFVPVQGEKDTFIAEQGGKKLLISFRRLRKATAAPSRC